MKRKLNRVLAMLLCVLMMSSDLTALIPPAQAAPAASASLASSTGGTPDQFEAQDNGRPNLFVHFLGDNYKYIYDSTGVNTGAKLGKLPIPAPYDQSALTNPGADPAATDPVPDALDVTGNTWKRYQNNTGSMVNETGAGAQVIFWVGLGIDRREVFELLKGNQGLTSLEAGFYYDSRYIEPYVDPAYTAADPDTAYKATIQAANIANAQYPANTQWSSDYEILRAETDKKPEADFITLEDTQKPSIYDIVKDTAVPAAAENPWKMTYVSLELKDNFDSSAKRRLAGEYVGVYGLSKDTNGNTIVPPSAHGTGMQRAGGNEAENDYQYLLMIPFRLKKYGSQYELALRLARDATHFSMGGGQEGVEPYAAWERVTTRNPGKDIKLLTNFQGDLHLFGDMPNDPDTEVPYMARLDIPINPSPLNTAELSVDGDPAVWPVKATEHLDLIHGLRSGIGMKLKLHVERGFTATVTVHHEENGQKVYHTYTIVTDQEEYTFVMPQIPDPNQPVIVTVIFTAGDVDYHVFLSEVSKDADGKVEAARKVGNEARILTNLDSTGAVVAGASLQIDSFDAPYSPHPVHSSSGMETHADGPMVMAEPYQRARIEVETHADYMAVVRIYNYATGKFIVNDLNITTAKNDQSVVTTDNSADYGKITLPYGGTISLTTPQADLEVEIVYQPAHRYKATLEVYHAGNATPTDMNTAQLAYLVYDDLNVSSNAYSGVVYHQQADNTVTPNLPEDHRAVKTGADNKQLPWVPKSQATQSGSLGGDSGRAGLVWNPNTLPDLQDQAQGVRTVMAQLCSASNLETFAGALNAIDLNTQQVLTDWTGLRKDLQGQSYGESDVDTLAELLWELRTRISNDATLKTAYEKSVTKDSSTLYTYLDLTPAQAQAYVLDLLEAQETQTVNEYQYSLARQAYLKVKALYDTENEKELLQGRMVAPQEPTAPAAVTAADANGVRKYTAADYQNTTIGSADGYLKQYYDYLTSYETYIRAVAAQGSITGIATPSTPPTAVAQKTIPLRPHDDGSDDDAVSRLDGYTFKPVEVGTSATIETREDRTVWLVLEADSAYEVDTVTIQEVNSSNQPIGPMAGVTVTPSPDYQNVMSFTMPKKDCVVQVTYKLRSARHLHVTVVGANDQPGNLATVEAYRVTDHDAAHYPAELPAVTPTLGTVTNAGHQDLDPYEDYIYNIFVDSVGTIRVKKASDEYSVTITALDHISRNPIGVSGPTTASDGSSVYTFEVVEGVQPYEDVDVTITFVRRRVRNTAHIRYDFVSGTPADYANDAKWRVENPGPPVTVTHVADTDAYEDDDLLGEVTVEAGYYIYGVVVRGASGTYPYTISGNGYNGGYGTAVSGTNDPVKLYVTMPDEELFVYVYLKKGIPDPEPVQTLTLTVKDPDNTETDPDKIAKNWAKATVYDVDASGKGDKTKPMNIVLPKAANAYPGGVLGRHKDYGNDHLYDWDYVETGKWVTVDFHADTGYHVSKVTVGPSNLGAAMIWESSSQVSFYMPAGSTGVTVEFAKGEAPTYFLTVRETWFDASHQAITGMEEKNYVTNANSYTISGDGPAGPNKGWNVGNKVVLRSDVNPERVPGADAPDTARGAAQAGEEVTMTYIVDKANWYVQSIILFSDGAATRLTDRATLIGIEGDIETYEVKFHMPTGAAEFAIHYRKGSKDTPPPKKDYAFTMVLYDSDNTEAAKDDNRLKATFTDATGGSGVHPEVELGLALATPLTNDVRHIHPGDVVTLETQLQPGYTVDYLIINPSNLNLYPSWQRTVTDASGVTKGVATFTMPNQGVAVVARYIKGEPQRYTANLILRPPAGYEDKMSQVGKGTFADPTSGALTDYPKKAIFSTTQTTGTEIDYDLYAADGFYIEKVTIEPAVGATGSLSGSFGYQDGSFVMPAANVNVNVWFKKGWPDEAKYGLQLEVHDAGEREGNYAYFRSAGSTAFTAPDSDHVHGGQTKTIWDAAYDKDTVMVGIHTEPRVDGDSNYPGYYYDDTTLTVTDTQGNPIPWWSVPGGIAFTMPPRTTKVVVTFKENDEDNPRPTYQAKLVLYGQKTGQATAADNDTAVLKDTSGNGAPASVDTDGGVIANLYPHDTLTLTTQPGTGRHIASAYAVYTVGGDTGVIPIYEDGALVAPLALAQFIPGTPGDSANAVTGRFAMPEANVTVYVRFAEGAAKDTDKWVTLKVSGPAAAGYASATVEEPSGAVQPAMTVYTLGGLPAIPASSLDTEGMDTRITAQGSETIVTFRPATDKGYDITKLEVYDKNGNSVPYEWISVIQDPPTLTDTNMWPAPPTDPTATITHPTWVKNPLRQIKLTVPVNSVTIHVTYGAVAENKQYTAQIVVNDDQYPTTPGTPASRNNGWFGLLNDTAQSRIRTAKPGEWVDLSVSVHPGYKIEYIKVIPQSYGVVPTLPYGDIYDQNTGFYMPNGDCTIYIKFVKDATAPVTATLMLMGAPVGDSANYGVIHSPISGASARATVGGFSRSVQARPTVDWITVDYYWSAADAIASISVETADGTSSVPYTHNEDPATRHGQIVLPMAAKDVTIIIVYKDDPTPVGQEVVLHVIDKDRDAAAPILRDPAGPGTESLNYGRLQAVYTVGADTSLHGGSIYHIGPDTDYQLAGATGPRTYESTATILVPAGERVDVSACSDILGLDGNGKVYIESAYVLYEAGGQMLNMNLTPDTPGPGFSGFKASHFTVRQGRNDVYVTLTRKAPTHNEYSAVLMLKGPVDNSGQAGICVGDRYDTAPADRRDALTQANHGHAYVTATQGEGITINVVPADGYAIDYIQVTPLGYPLNYTYLVDQTTVKFPMPHCNIAITVYLKKAAQTPHKLTLHYVEDTGTEHKTDYAKLSWTKEDGNGENIWAWKGGLAGMPAGATINNWGDETARQVVSGTPVTLQAALDAPDVILAAYVLSDGDLVKLNPTIPTTDANVGLEGAGETASTPDNSVPDVEAAFNMPDADADVYVVVTNNPPSYPDWHTVILTASDYAPSGNNQGFNSGSIQKTGDASAPLKTVKSFGSKDVAQSHAYLTLPQFEADGVTPVYFTVTAYETSPYELVRKKTHQVFNNPYNIQYPTALPGTPPTYQEAVGSCNQVFHLVFESDEDLTLTVEIDDPDNPGNGTVTNAVTAKHADLDDLDLYSKSVAGAYQLMSGVTSGEPVDLVVTPTSGYRAYAFLYQNDGSEPVEVPLTATSGGKYTGSFLMPTSTSRVVVTFYKPYDATLILRDNTAGGNSTAKMTESTGTAPDQVDVYAQITPTATLYNLPHGTGLKASMGMNFDSTGKKVTGLLTRKGSTTFLPATPDAGVDYYLHTINRADATITLVVDETGTAGEEYLAAVSVLNRPDTLADDKLPTIVADPVGSASGSIWTTAKETGGVTVHVTVPVGYTAELTTDSALSLDGGIDTIKTLTADGDTTFTMPAHNVQVTVKYVKTHHRLTLHVTDTSGVPGNATVLTPASVLGSGLSVLDADGESTYVKTGETVTLTATPVVPPAADPGAKLKRIIVQVEGEAPRLIDIPDPAVPYDSAVLNDLLPTGMPAADVDVTVIYASAKTPPTPPEPDWEDYYLAMAVKVDADNDPGNRIVSIQNTTRTHLLDGTTALPAASPFWTAGYAQDAVTVSYETAPDYYVSVTAQTADGAAVLLVLAMGDTGVGTATTAFPNPGKDIVITVTYSKGKPEYQEKNVALQLVDHEIETGNKAQTTVFPDNTLTGLTLNGTATTHAPGYTDGVQSKDPVELEKSQTITGDDLRTLANWADGYQVVRMTLAVRTVTPGIAAGDPDIITETGEVDLLVSRYGGNATTRCPTPPLGDNQIAVLRVYYGNIYDATLHVVGADVPYDVTEATDNRPSPISSTGSVPIKNTGDKLEDFQGGESVMTTAKPDTAGVGGTKKRLVGVVWESDLTGAQPTTAAGNDRYNFDMPQDDVDFYAVYEPEPDDPDDRTYIAKVALAADSEPISGTANALSIRNTNNTAAPKGKYWVAAKDGDGVVINVKVAQGYQAQIITTKVDDQSNDVLNKLPDLVDGSTTRKPTADDDYQYYINRTQFVYNLPDGKDATFTMPADTDATVTVRFTKGYDLTLNVADASLLDATGFTTEENTADLAYDSADHLAWKNDATTADKTITTDGVYTDGKQVLQDREGGKSVTTEVTTYDQGIKVKVTRTTPFTGTQSIVAGATGDYPFVMPYEDTLETVLLQNADAADAWMAKVELAGESDVNGNTATPVIDRTDTVELTEDTDNDGAPDAPANVTTTGAVWTTTSEAHVIDLSLTVASGYVAKIKVRRDNDNYYNNPTDPTKWDYLDAWRYDFTKTTDAGSPTDPTTAPLVSDPGALEAGIDEVSIAYGGGYLPASAFPDTVSGRQNFRFVMPRTASATGNPGDVGYDPGDAMSDVTILVTFERVSDMPRPFDPDNQKMDKIDLDRGFIYGENRGDFAVIQIPTLAKEEGESAVKLYDTDNYDTASATPVIHDATKAADKEVKRYIFALYDAAADKYTELEDGSDVMLAPYDEDALAAAGDLYNYILGLYEGYETLDDDTTPKRQFVGSKLLLLPKPKADGTFTTGGQKLYEMLNNDGSLEAYQAPDPSDTNKTVTRYRTTLYVMAEDAAKRQSDYTPVWIRPWFGLGVNVISYGPTHPLEGELYKLKTTGELNVLSGYWDENQDPIPGSNATEITAVDESDIRHYRWNDDTQPDFTDSIVLDDDTVRGSGQWLQVLTIRSSELLGGFTTAYDPAEDLTASPAKTLLDNVDSAENLTYALLVKKESNLTYRRLKIDLNPHSSRYTAANPLTGYYQNNDPATRTFMIQDTVHLIAGDVDANGRTKFQDYDIIYDYVYRNEPWTEVKIEPTKPTVAKSDPLWTAYEAALADWNISVYNPDAWPYYCDLDGDRKLTVADLDIVRTAFNYNRTEKDYNWMRTSDSASILPFGLGKRSDDYASLFALGQTLEGELLADEYWDALLPPETEEPVPMDILWVDAKGNLTQEPADRTGTAAHSGLTSHRPETPAASGDKPSDPGERAEIPLGEEAGGGQVSDLPVLPDA